MICVSIKDRALDDILDIVNGGEVEMAEIRLDSCDLSDEDIDILFGDTDIPLVATCRCAEVGEEECWRRLSVAVEAGAKYVDLEIEAPAQLSKKVRRLARENGTIFIRSYHNFECTPSYEELEAVVSECRQFGGEVVKIATMARSAGDVETVFRLYGFDREGSLVAFCMGEAGRQSRFDCLRNGSPFTYAALSGEDSVLGQWDFREMKSCLYGSRKPLFIEDFKVPSSKSFAQRAIIAAALADGTSRLSGYTSCADNESALGVARALGAKVVEGAGLEITGIGRTDGKLGIPELNVGESGLLARLMIPLLSVVGQTPAVVTGERTLLNRPLNDANDIMASFGVVLTNAGDRKGKDVFVPVRLSGELIPGRADISGRGGSQLISGLLMALPLAGKDSFVCVQDPRSIPYMFVTMDVLRRFGIKVSNEIEGDEEIVRTKDWNGCSAINFRIRGGQEYHPAEFRIEGDWSTAANFMVAGTVFGEVRLDGLDVTSVQADLSILDVLSDAGACISIVEDGPVIVKKAPLNAFCTDLNNAPDIFPIVAVLAAFCPGRSRIAGVGRLAGKESDRAAAILENLGAMGVDAFIENDELVVDGHSLSCRLATGQLLKGGKLKSFHDHRMVMAFKVAALGADSPVALDDEGCVSKSFPQFNEWF